MSKTERTFEGTLKPLIKEVKIPKSFKQEYEDAELKIVIKSEEAFSEERQDKQLALNSEFCFRVDKFFTSNELSELQTYVVNQLGKRINKVKNRLNKDEIDFEISKPKILYKIEYIKDFEHCQLRVMVSSKFTTLTEINGEDVHEDDMKEIIDTIDISLDEEEEE